MQVSLESRGLSSQFLVNKQNKEVNRNVPFQYEKNNFNFPSYDFYNIVSFKGGFSENLAATKRHLDENNTKYPEGLKNEIEKTLQIGNDEKLKLIDVHLRYYAHVMNSSTAKHFIFLK